MKILRVLGSAIAMFAMSVSVGVLIAARNYAIVGSLICLAIAFSLFNAFSAKREAVLDEPHPADLIKGSIGIILMSLLLGLVWPAVLIIVATGRGVERRKSKSEGADLGIVRPADPRDPSS